MENFFWGIIAGAVIVLAAFLIPAILQITRTAKAAENFLKTTQESLNPLILRLNETVDGTNRVVSGVEESVNNVRHLTKAVGETGAIIADVNKLLRQAGAIISATTSSFGAGITTALGVLIKGIFQKKTSQE